MTSRAATRASRAAGLPLAAAMWLVADSLMFAVMNLIVRVNVLDVDPRVALALRYAFGIPIAWAAIRLIEPKARRTGVGTSVDLSIPKLRLLACACTALISNAAWYEAISVLSLSVATMVFYTKGFFLILLTAMLFGERVRAHHAFACALGFGGVILITGVEGPLLRAGVWLVLVSAFASALMILQIKALSRYMTPLRLTLALLVLGAPLSFCLAVPVWTWPSPGVLACFALVALLSVGIHVAIANAYRRGAVASLVPFDFLRLVFVLVLEALVLDLNAPMLAWVGTALVLIALVVNAAFDRRHASALCVPGKAGAAVVGKPELPIAP